MVSHNNLRKNTFYTPNLHNLPYLPSTIAETDRTSGLKYQKVHHATMTGGNTRNTKYKTVPNKTFNNGQVITTGVSKLLSNGQAPTTGRRSRVCGKEYKRR
jgi:hypothetical protein